MNLKNLLKNLKLNENNISMLLGAAVIVIVGFLIVNYFKNLENGTTLPTTSTTADETTPVKLPTKHTVEEGETLWSIAEKYYGSGYNWVDIQKENNLSNASVITKGAELTIPNVAAKTATTKSSPLAVVTEPTAKPEASPSATVIAEASPSATPEVIVTTKGGVPATNVSTTAPEASITGDSYTVVHGDNLWSIAVKAYGNGYKWTEIAKANNLSHPGVIHAGNVLQLPR